MRVRLAALTALLVLAVPPAASAWTWPVDGPVLRPFSFGSDPYAAGQHRGIDIGAPSGTPVRAAAGGFVSFAGTVPNGGKTVTIQTSTGYAVTLVHLGSIRVFRGTTIEEGATVGTVGPSGVPDIPEPYVYLGIRVASDDQGYLDPLRFLPPRAEPPAAPESAADPPSAPADQSSGSESSAPPVATEPPPAPPVPAETGEASSDTSQPATTPEPASEPVPAAGVEEPPATLPAAAEAPAAAPPAAATPSSAPDASSEAAPATQGQGPAGGRAALPAEEPVPALGGSARAGTSTSAAAFTMEASVTPMLSVGPVEHHAAPAGATYPRRVDVAVATEPAPRGAVVRTPLARESQPHRAGATAVLGADATKRVRSRPRAAPDGRPLDDLWILAALATALAVAFAIRRHRRRPGATPAGTEAPRMMVLVGGLQHEADAPRVDRPTPSEHDERLAA